MEITRAQVDHFLEHGWLLTDVLSPDDVARVRLHVDEVGLWDDTEATGCTTAR